MLCNGVEWRYVIGGGLPFRPSGKGAVQVSMTGTILMRITNRRRSCALGLLRRISVIGPVLAIILLPLLIEQTANAQCQYEVTGIIQAPPCGIVGPPNTFPAGMSEDGKVVGRYEICGTPWNEAFLWTPNPDGQGGTFTTLPRPAGVISATASDVNSAGFVIGGHLISGEGWTGFIFDPNTEEFTYLKPLHEVSPQTASTVNAINESNVVVGSRVINAPGDPAVTNAVIWHPYGENGNGREVVIDLGDFGVGPNSTANNLNEDGTIIGWTGEGTPGATAYILASDSVTLIANDFGATSSNLFGLNSAGVVGGAGKFFGDPLTIAFLLDGIATTFIDPLPGYTQSGVNSLNDLGQAVIRSTPGDAGGLYQHGKQVALNPLMVRDESLTIFAPRSINNDGQMLARALLISRTVGVVIAPIDRSATDMNADCVTDFYDLLMLLDAWGPCGEQVCPADFTQSGSVGVPDLLVLLSNWG